MSKELVNESSLTRLWDHMQKHDCGVITANRSRIWDPETKKYGPKLTVEDNRKRNRKLQAVLQVDRYDLTSVRGGFYEQFGTQNQKKVCENSFFVCDLDDRGELLKDLKLLGNDYNFNQESILFIPKGGMYAELHGTSNSPEAYPGFGQVDTFNKRMFGVDGAFFTEVGGRPFYFYNDNLIEHLLPEGYVARWGCFTASKQKWENIYVHPDWRKIQ